MKSILFAILFLFVPKFCISQGITANDDAVYLDSLFNMGNEKNYKYIRIIKDYKIPNQESYKVKDFYKSGKIAMSGTTSKRDKIIKTGTFVYYYENGNKKSITNYKLDKKDGEYFEFYENGNKKEAGENILDDKKNKSEHKINQFWDINGVQKVSNGNGFYEDQGESESEKGEIKNGFKDGIWEGSFNKLNFSYKETYKDGKLISGISISADGITNTYSELEKKPEPKYGMNDFYKFIGKNYKIPVTMPKGIKGKVYITFVVDNDGKIVEPKILRDIGYGTGQEAIRVVTVYKGFTPGEQRGQKVRCSYSLPLTIQNPY